MGLRMPGTPQPLSKNDLWHLVIQRVDILSLLSLWKTSRTFRSIISQHERNICLQVAHNTFPPNIVARLKKSVDEPASLDWLEDLIPRFLASVVVDRVRFRLLEGPNPRFIRCGVPATDPQGAPLRERVADGWRIAMRLSSVLKAAERDPKHTLGKKPKSWRTRLPEMHVKEAFIATKEKAKEKFEFDTPIFKIIRRFFGGLSYPELHNLRLLDWYLAESISRIFVAEDVASEKFRQAMDISRRDLEYYVLWKICRDGPLLYWQQWWEDRNEPEALPISTKVIEDMASCNKEKLKLAVQLGVAIRHLARPPGLPQSASDSVGFMKSFCENAYVLPASEKSLSDPLMERTAYRADSEPFMPNPAYSYSHSEHRTRLAAFVYWE